MKHSIPLRVRCAAFSSVSSASRRLDPADEDGCCGALEEEPGAVRVFLESLGRALSGDAVAEGWPEEAGEWLGELLEAGAVGCFPASG